MPDPVGVEIGYERIMAHFIDTLISDHNSRSGTIRVYIDSINALFSARGFGIPADLANKDNLASILYQAWKKEETIARQRAPLTPEIFAQLKIQADQTGQDSVETVVFDYFCVIRISGLRGGEYAKKLK